MKKRTKKINRYCSKHHSYMAIREPQVDCSQCWIAWFESFHGEQDLFDYLLLKAQDEKNFRHVMEVAFRAGQHFGACNPYV